MAVDATETIAALSALQDEFTTATRQIVSDAAHIIQALGMKFAPVGTPGNSTNMPGDLRRSIDVEGPVPLGNASFLAKVGPTTIYGRQRELGGAIYPVRVRFMHYYRWGVPEWRKRVYQKPEPYMKPGRAAAKQPIFSVMIAKLTAVIEEAR